MTVGPTDLDQWRRVCLGAYVNLPADTCVTMSQVDQVLTLGAPQKAALDEGLWVAGAYKTLTHEVSVTTGVLAVDVDAILTQSAKPAAELLAASDGSDLVALRLVPVQVFGAGCRRHCPPSSSPNSEDCVRSYGLMDAVSSWSDCNRAEGRTYRLDELDNTHREEGDVVEVLVRRRDLPWFSKRFSETGPSPDEVMCEECARPFAAENVAR